MARRNIFELISSQWDRSVKVERLRVLFEKEKLIFDFNRRISYSYTVKSFVDAVCFDGWKSRGRCIGVDDFLQSLNYEVLISRSEESINDFLLFLEIIANFWKMSEVVIRNSNEYEYSKNFNHLIRVIHENLSHHNHKIIYNEIVEQVIVIEDKPEAVAVAEIVESAELAMSILKYNHYSLKGDIENKKAILNQIYQSLEPNRKELESVDKRLTTSIFYLINNMNIRHNNITESDKHYKQVVANMEAKELELWYDELYQMMLLIFLKNKQIERDQCFKKLKAKIESEQET